MSNGVWQGEIKGEQLHVTAQPPNQFGGAVSVNTTTSTVTYTWGAADFLTVGRFRIILWAGNSTNRVGSAVFEYHVTDAPGGTPTV